MPGRVGPMRHIESPLPMKVIHLALPILECFFFLEVLPSPYWSYALRLGHEKKGYGINVVMGIEPKVSVKGAYYLRGFPTPLSKNSDPSQLAGCLFFVCTEPLWCTFQRMSSRFDCISNRLEPRAMLSKSRLSFACWSWKGGKISDKLLRL